jgi:tetratricopeptide (TPR) repeat protein
MIGLGGGSLSPLDYSLEIVQEAISKLPLHYQVLFTVIVVVLVLFYAVNRKIFDKWVETHRRKLNRLFKITLSILFLCFVAFFIVDNFYSPKPPEDQLVVAISPFYLIDEYGQSGSDINTRDDFKERLEAEKDLGINVIMLDNPIRENEDARYWGKKVGAHLVVYGETRKKIGNIGEVKYYILPLPSLAIISSEMLFSEVRSEEEKSFIITRKATFHSITENPIAIIESLTENASSAIYAIGAFENYKKSNFTSATTFFKSIKNYDNQSVILFLIANCYCFNNNLNECIEYYEKAIDLNPHYTEAWYNKGSALDELGRYEEALAAYDHAVDINSQFTRAWYNKGVALGKLGRYGNALTACDKAIDINPQDATAWYNKGISLSYLGRHKEAKEAFEKAYEIDPTIEIL